MFILKMAERMSDIAGVIAALLTIPLIASLVYEVFSRYVLGSPTYWVYEVSYMLMGSIFALAMGYALKIKQHVSVDLIYARLSARSKAVVDVIGYCAFGFAVWWMTIELFASVINAYQNGEVTGKSAWSPVVWPVYTTWFLGFFMYPNIISAGTKIKPPPIPSNPPINPTDNPNGIPMIILFFKL